MRRFSDRAGNAWVVLEAQRPDGLPERRRKAPRPPSSGLQVRRRDRGRNGSSRGFAPQPERSGASSFVEQGDQAPLTLLLRRSEVEALLDIRSCVEAVEAEKKNQTEGGRGGQGGSRHRLSSGSQAVARSSCHPHLRAQKTSLITLFKPKTPVGFKNFTIFPSRTQTIPFKKRLVQPLPQVDPARVLA